MTFWSWLRSIPSEPTGEGSASRVGLLLITLTLVILLLGFLHYQHTIPTHEQLMGIAAIISAAGATYGANKVATALTKKDDSQ